MGGAFKLALVLTHETGHRIGAIRQLKWSDVDFGSGNVKWRAEVDKIRYEHVTPLTPAAMEALRAARKARKAIGDGWDRSIDGRHRQGRLKASAAGPVAAGAGVGNAAA